MDKCWYIVALKGSGGQGCFTKLAGWGEYLQLVSGFGRLARKKQRGITLFWKKNRVCQKLALFALSGSIPMWFDIGTISRTELKREREC